MHGIACQSQNRSSDAAFDSRMSNRPLVSSGRQRVERADDLADLGRDRAAGGAGQQRRRLGQPVQMLALRPVQPQRPRQRVEHLRARVDLAALLEPGVPGDADAREQRQFLPAQPGRAPPRPVGQAEVGGRQLRPPCLEKLPQLLAPPILRDLAAATCACLDS